MICILSSSHCVTAKSKAFFFVFAFKICLRHQSVTSPFLNGATPPKTPPKKNPGSSPVVTQNVSIVLKFNHKQVLIEFSIFSHETPEIL